MTDIEISYDSDNQFGDIAVDALSKDLVRDEGLATSVLISLFTDRRVTQEDVSENDTYLGGYFAEDVDNIQYGSRLFTLDRSKTTVDTVRLIDTYAAEALQWLVDDGIAGSVEAKAVLVNGTRIDLSVKVIKDGATIVDLRFEDLWASTFSPPEFPSAPPVGL